MPSMTRHDVSLNLNYEVLPRILTLSLVWIYASGNSMTIPVSYYFYNGTLITGIVIAMPTECRLTIVWISPLTGSF